MTDYPYEGQLIADPVTFQRATNAQVYVYDANDTNNTTPLALKDATGLPTSNPLVSSADAFVKPIYAPSQDIKYVGAGLTVFVSSAKGMRDAASASAEAAQTAADSATAAAGQAVASASVNGSGELLIQQASGATLNAGPVKGAKGDKGDKGDTGAPGVNGSNVLPTDAAIAQALQDPNSQTRAAGNAMYAQQWKPATAYLAGQPVVSPSGDLVTAKADHTSGSSFTAANWNAAPAVASKADKAEVVPVWKANTAYTSGQLAVSPTGDLISAKTGFTSGATFNAANWNYSTITPSGVDTKVGAAISAAGAQTPPATALLPPKQKRTMIQTFQSGHGYSSIVGAGGGSVALNDTTDSAIGTQSVKVVTSGTGTTSSIYRFNIPTPFDMTGKQLAMLVKCDDPTHLKTLNIWIGNGGLSATFNFTINNVAPAEQLDAGAWMWVTIPWQQISGGASATIGTPDRAAIAGMQINIADDNTGNPVTIRVQAVASVPVPSVWTTGCLTFDFDDGFATHYTVARKALAKYDYKADVYPVCEAIDSGAAYMTLAQLQELQNSNGWLVGAHSDTWAHHNMALSDQTASELATFVATNRNWLSTRGLRGYDFFAYPGGKSGGANLPIARQYYATARTVSAVLHETLPANDPHKLRVFVVGAGTTLAIAQAEVNAAIAGNYHLIMVFHDLATSGTGIMTTANFGAFVDWVATTTIAVKNMAEVLATR